jgi:hypothetical protein
MNRRNVLICVSIVLAGSIAGAAALRHANLKPTPPVPTQVAKSVVKGFVSQSAPSFADLEAINDYMVGVGTLPTGFAAGAFQGSASIALTGMELNETDEQQISVTVVDEIADIDYAELYNGTQLLFTATRAAGSIVNRASLSIATLTAFVPFSNVTIRVRWISTGGKVREESLSY